MSGQDKAVLREKRTIEAMIRIYCMNHHPINLCEECNVLLAYALKRIEKCQFGPMKPACNNCTVHCYSPGMREKIRQVMRFSGPRMLWKHPALAFYHLIKEYGSN